MRGALKRIARNAAIFSALSCAFVSPAISQRRVAVRAPIADFAFLIGAWTDGSDCSTNTELMPDGMFHTTANGHGLWVLDGDRLIMTGTTTVTLRIAAIDGNHIRATQANGATAISTRCPAGGPTARLPAPRLSPAFLEGRWTDNGNCANATSFDGNGGFMIPSGGQGRWSLAGNQLSLAVGGAGSTVLRLFPIGPNTIMAINPDGSGGRSTRC